MTSETQTLPETPPRSSEDPPLRSEHRGAVEALEGDVVRRAELAVLAGLPPAVAVGLFAEPFVYPARVRVVAGADALDRRWVLEFDGLVPGTRDGRLRFETRRGPRHSWLARTLRSWMGAVPTPLLFARMCLHFGHLRTLSLIREAARELAARARREAEPQLCGEEPLVFRAKPMVFGLRRETLEGREAFALRLCPGVRVDAGWVEDLEDPLAVTVARLTFVAP